MARSSSTDPTYKEWKLGLSELAGTDTTHARILPTRNGNLYALSISSHEGVARILPTRNGNNGSCGCRNTSNPLCTDPTYKEWKRAPSSRAPPDAPSTNPTYKEWKQWGYFCLRTVWRTARILPTRNGNLSEWDDMITGAIARILPTRNGNARCNRSPRSYEFARILPTRNGNAMEKKHYRVLDQKHGSYLQGMETRRKRSCSICLRIRTDPTYKEWKLSVVAIV